MTHPRAMPRETPIQFRIVDANQVIDLRHRILRAGLPRESAIFPGDEAATSVHLAACDGDRLIACATLHLNEYAGQPAWQLRGMAVDDGFRGTGVGTSLLRFLEQTLLTRGPIRQLWCNARLPAQAFYQRNGWRVDSQPFDIPTAGPHVRMSKRLLEGPPLTYAPGTLFVRRRSALQQALIYVSGAAAGIAAMVILIEWMTSQVRTVWWRYLLYTWSIAIVFGIVAAMSARVLRRGGHWEIRIEGDALYLTRPGRPTRLVPLAQIDCWIRRWVTRKTSDGTETVLRHELRLRDGRRIRLDLYRIGSLRPLRRALRQANPQIDVQTLRR